MNKSTICLDVCGISSRVGSRIRHCKTSTSRATRNIKTHQIPGIGIWNVDFISNLCGNPIVISDAIAKGNVLATARLAGIQAAKKTGELIPLCHPLPITHCEVTFAIPARRDRVVITASAKIAAQTGVEMEALTAVTVAALTIYDMCKAVDKAMVIGDVRLVKKTKGK